jgi:hypothetical protein
VVPAWTGAPPAADSSSDRFAGTVRWNPNVRGFNTDRKRSEALDKYLAVVDTLFYKDTDRHVGQEQALFFLHQCDYDIPLANRLLKPWAPPGTHDKHKHTHAVGNDGSVALSSTH